LRREAEKKPHGSHTTTRARPDPIDLPAEAKPVFESLRSWRGEVAKSNGVPAYVIFHDATLREIALARPESLDDLSHISGVGARKLQAYGEEILRCVQRP
ncbi:HRDC domain-containing protein, partial [Bordetella bronchiseptica]